MQLCTRFNDCKFVITPTVKLGIAKQLKTFYKNTEKKFKCKKKQKKTKNYAHSRIEKYIQIFVTVEEKVLSLGKFRVIATGGQGGLTLHLGLQKIRFLEHHIRSRKPTMMQNIIITFNPTYLIKVTYISSILKFKYQKFSGSSFKHQIKHPKFAPLNLITNRSSNTNCALALSISKP